MTGLQVEPFNTVLSRRVNSESDGQTEMQCDACSNRCSRLYIRRTFRSRVISRRHALLTMLMGSPGVQRALPSLPEHKGVDYGEQYLAEWLIMIDNYVCK